MQPFVASGTARILAMPNMLQASALCIIITIPLRIVASVAKCNFSFMYLLGLDGSACSQV